MESLHGLRHSNPLRSFNGCWTCRLRRKKCDEIRPVCDACGTLHITCYFSSDKPEWMDGGVKQEEMAERLKREIKDKAHLRRRERSVYLSGDHNQAVETASDGSMVLPHRHHELSTTPVCDRIRATPDIHRNEMESCPEGSTVRPRRGADCTHASKDGLENITFGRSDTILLMFYLDDLLPFLFPFYQPSLLQGGRAWILELMISSPVVRQATLCQSSYFFSLAWETANRDELWETVLKQTGDAFEVLRQSLQVIDGSGIAEHLHGAVRILTSIMQVQRFEITILSFNNCRSHLNAGVALFRQLLDSTSQVEQVGPTSSFNTVIDRLGPWSWELLANFIQVPSAEQAAFRFSSTLLILDDIIASTILQEEPRLYDYHHSLLCSVEGSEPTIDLKATSGCENWALLQIGKIAVLDAWKQRCKIVGNLDVITLVYRATAIKDLIEAHLTQLESDSGTLPNRESSLLNVLTANFFQHSNSSTSQTSLVTRVWAHAALLYLSVVISGWQPASVNVRYHVGRIIELLSHQISPPALLRTMVWPFCVAGCLAGPDQEAVLRGMVDSLQPPSVFGTVRKALEIMENVWRHRDSEDAASCDFATCFRSQGDLVLLV